MEKIRTYALKVETDLARIALEGANIPAVVVGDRTGGMLFVPKDRIEAALKLLEDLGTTNVHLNKPPKST